MASADKPPWLRQRWTAEREEFEHVREALRKRDLVTVCEEASCPNVDECWSDEGTATFMLMGDTCTRGCGFCDVATGGGEELDPMEPAKVAGAVDDVGLDYAVVTSVDRDDLADGGAAHFASTVEAIHHVSDALVEALIPDFQGDREALETLVDSEPEVVAHNVETVERLQEKVRDPRAGYGQSLEVLQRAKEMGAGYTKSSLMLGVGEAREEVVSTLEDLRDADVDVVTLGQYMQPSEDHVDVERWVPPEEFDALERKALDIGFEYVASGPFVRSSYRAGELYLEHAISGSGTEGV